MNIEINKANMKIENGKLIIDIDTDLEKFLKRKNRLSEIKPGTVINGKYIVLEQLCGKTIVVRKELLNELMSFDKCGNDWRSSSLRKYLNDTYLKEVESEFGEKNILNHDTDLLSLDGLDDYGHCSDKIGLLSIDQYRKYRKLLTPVNKAWWLVTPDSTPSGTSSSDVNYVHYFGDACFCVFSWKYGVRPVFHVKSDIFVSCEG